MSSTDAKPWQIDLTAAAVCLLIGGAVYFVGLKPIVDRQSERIEQQDRLTELRAEASRLGADLNNARTTLTRIRMKIQESAIQLQSTRHLNSRLAEVTALATECGLQVDEIQPGSVTTGERYETVPLSLAGTGRYEACARFMHRLQKAFPDTGVSSFELVGKPRTPGAAASFDLGLIWFAAPTQPLAEAE